MTEESAVLATQADRLAELAMAQGELVIGGANRPIPLDDPRTAWFVEQGGLDVFLVEYREEGFAANWQHLLRADEGRVVFGVEPGGGELRTIAKGLPGSRLWRVGLDDLLRGDVDGALAAQVDAWVSELSAGVASEVEPRPRTSVVVGVGESVDAEAGSVVSVPPGGVVWVQAEAGAAYLGTEQLEPDSTGLVPLTSDAWLDLSRSSLVVGVASSEMARGQRLFSALGEYHRLALRAEEFNRRLVLADEVNEQTGRTAYHRLAAGRARQSLFSVLGSSTAASGEVGAALLEALEVVGEHEGIAFRSPPRARGVSEEASLDDIIQASGVRARKVQLSVAGRWWRGDSGAMLAFRADDGQPVALVPRAMGRYRMVDPASGQSTPIGPPEARLLDKTAWGFYRPLPDDRSIGLRELARFAVANTGSDWIRFAVAGFLASVLLLVPSLFVKTLATWVLASQDGGALIRIITVIAVAAVVAGLMVLLQGMMLMRLEGRTMANVAAAVMDRTIDLPVGFFRRFTAGDLAKRLTAFWVLRDQVSGLVAHALLGVVCLLPGLGLIFVFNTALGWLSLGVGLATLAVIAVLGLRMVAPRRREFAIASRLSGSLLQFIGGMDKLRSAGAEGSAFAVWARGYREQLLARREIDNLGKQIGALSIAMPALAATGLFIVASGQGADQLTAGDFLAAYLVSSVFYVAIASLGLSVEAATSVVPLWEQVSPMLEEVPESREETGGSLELRGGLRLDQVSFRYYEDGPLVLDEVSIEAQPGEFVAIVGESGAGKSTVMRMVLGLEEPTGGAVYYDNHDLSNLAARSVRRQIGVVAQDGSLQPGNLLDNIIGVSADLTIEDAWRAARLADVDEDIDAMPMKMFTVVGDSMATFSGGQMQRIRIAAALVRNPPIVLMDEATSWLDADSQARVMRGVENLAVTRVVIAHRLSTIRNADRIYVMSGGRVVQQGAFEELYETEGVFRNLVERQMA